MHSRRARRSRGFRHFRPVLRFTPYAWARLLFLRDRGPTEVGAFGITGNDDPFRVEDVQLVRQACTPVTVTFDDDSVADFFDSQIDQGRLPPQFGRIWVHTHPGHSASPSGTDEATFDRCFGRTDWAVMMILARGGRTYARLRYGIGPGGQLRVPVAVDYTADFPASDPLAWEAEYLACVIDTEWRKAAGESPKDSPGEEREHPRFVWCDETLLSQEAALYE